jgi:thiol peroxidase
MSTITFKGNAVETAGSLPATGTKAPAFTLTGKDLKEVTLDQFSGQNVILNIFPSIDTGVCAASTRHFNQSASALKNTSVLCISKDLPFAFNRFCGAEGLDKVITLSQFKDQNFSKSYGVDMTNGPLAGLMSRAVVVINPQGEVVYTEQVPEIAQEPDYDRALAAVQG